MKTRSSAILMASLVLGLSVAAYAGTSGHASANVPVTQLKYGPTGLTDGAHGELYVAAAYGDTAHGPHGTFLKMPAGYVSPLHTHSEDYWGVVISGVAVNASSAPNSADTLLPPGSYWYQKGGEPHVTKCVSANECIFFVSQNGKFDFEKSPASK